MKILVSDFDYTFFNLNYLENIKAVQHFVADGHIFILATSRNLRQVVDEVKDFYVPYFFLICNDGAIIYDRSEKVLFKKEIPKDIVKPLFREFDRKRPISETYIDNDAEYNVDEDSPALKIIAKPRNYEGANKLMQKVLSKYPQIHGYLTENWIHITAKEVTKGKAIDFLADKFHFNKDDIYVIGDNLNDVSMFKKYKGYTPEECDPVLLKYSIGTVSSITELINRLNELP